MPSRSPLPHALCLTAALIACSPADGDDDDTLGLDSSSGDPSSSVSAPSTSVDATSADASGPDATGNPDDSGTDASSDDDSDSSDDDTGDPPTGECGAVPTFEDGLSPSAERHVANDGSDGNGCGDVGAPCATLEGALAGVQPGTAIRIHPGTYGGGAYVSGLAGTAEAPIWIGGVPGEARPVFEGGDVAMHLSGARYVVLHDIEVRNMALDGINIDDGGAVDDPEATQHLVLRGLYIHDIGTGGNNDCLKLSGVNDFAVLDVEISACGGASGSAIDHVGCHRGVVAYSNFHDLQASANAVQTKGGSSDIEIRGNRFDHAGERSVNMGGSTGFEFFRPPLDAAGINAEARDIRVVSNLFLGSPSPVALVGCVGCLVAHNTLIEPEHWVFRVLQETTSSDGYTFAPSGENTVVDNLIVFSRGLVGTVVNVGPDTAPETFTFSNNLWFASDDPGQSDPGLPVAESNGVVGVDPGLADDGSIAAGSPAAGAGIAIDGIDGDHLGRCFGEPPSIGAFEVP